jgi:type I restriction enzyme S subunit
MSGFGTTKDTKKHEKMQPSTFMEKLLDGAEVEWVPLGEVSNVLRGKRLTKKQLSDAEVFPVFHGGLEPLGYYDQSNRPANTVMVINVGMSQILLKLSGGLVF